MLAAFNLLHTYGLYTGPSMAATVDTAEFSGPYGQRVLANLARPLIDLNQPLASIQPLTRGEIEGESLVPGIAVPQEIDGNCPILSEGRFMRFRTTVPAGATWTNMRGVSITRKAGGKY